MDRSLALLVIGLFFGGGIGFVTAASLGVTLDGHDHSQPHGKQIQAKQHESHKQADGTSSGSDVHRHSQPRRLSAGSDAPSITAAVHEDPASGWNLHVVTSGFRFAPENASKEHVIGEGHAHVYANGKKIARLYGPWLHIAELPAGEAVVKVTMNSNDHPPLFIENEPLAISVTASNG